MMGTMDRDPNPTADAPGPQSLARDSGPTTPARLPLPASVAGWYGTAAILTAYFASSHGWMEQGLEYQLLNLTGAAGVGWVCWLRRTWQPLLLKVAWGLVALSALAGL